jgi:hypothetical protein
MELKIDKLAMLVGVSTRTINNWYWFKSANPNNEYAKMLPDYRIDKKSHGSRVWDSNDVDKLIDFKSKIPHGRNGVLGDITQRYERKKKNEAKSDDR